jgi:hypothetical protein
MAETPSTDQKPTARTVLVLALFVGLLLAIRHAWLTDDAFISFRYARNLLDGHGLVYNVGERVEGYTNFLWTMWTALGLSIGVEAGLWSNIWSITAYLGCILLLGMFHLRLRTAARSTPLVLPVAALGAALHVDWSIFATSGLETSAFTFLILAGYMLLVRPCLGGAAHPFVAGIVFALASMTRPDGVLLALAGGVFVLWQGRPRIQHALWYALGFALLAAPYQWWRVSYYGDWYPNTYYAKSADRSWWSQGWIYVRLYFERYAALLFGVGGAVVAIWPHRSGTAGGEDESGAAPNPGRMPRAPAVLALVFAVGYTIHIARFGGDFMFARMLIPAAPFFLIGLELGLWRVVGWIPMRTAGQVLAALGILLVASPLVLPPPVTDKNWRECGVANEWMYHRTRLEEFSWQLTIAQYMDHRASVMRKYLHDLPVRVAFLGGEARAMYRAMIPLAIESSTGLTDHYIARQPLRTRGRVGHEKPAPVEYLVEARKAHFCLSPSAPEFFGLDGYIPLWMVELDDIVGYVLHWDPEMMAELRRRGARFGDVEQFLDQQVIPQLSQWPRERVSDVYAKFKRFYFDHVSDPVRESAFLRALPTTR